MLEDITMKMVDGVFVVDEVPDRKPTKKSKHKQLHTTNSELSGEPMEEFMKGFDIVRKVLGDL